MGHTASFSSSSGRSRWLSRRCALVGLHLLTAEDEAGSCGSHSQDLGQCEHDVESLALNVVVQDQCEKISLFLEDWKLAKVTLGHLLLWICGEMHEAWRGCAKRLFVTRKAFLSPWRGCDNKGEGCGERSDKLKVRSSGEFVWPGFVSFEEKSLTT